jgi:hypothetical protein
MNRPQKTYNFDEQPDVAKSEFRVVKGYYFGNKLAIHEIFYDNDGEVIYYNDPVMLESNDIESLIKNMSKYAKALEKDILNEKDILSGKVVYKD